MYEVIYFDWNGTRNELEEYCKKVKAACVKNGLTYKGCHGPPQDRYHYAIFIENEKVAPSTPEYDSFNPVFGESGGKPPQMGHLIFKYYVGMGI